MSAIDELLHRLAAAARAGGLRPSVHRYGPGPEQVADLMLPDGEGPHPLTVLLHGGFWRASFTRTLMEAMAVDLASRGWASLNVEYRRTGNGGGPVQTLEDVAAALALLQPTLGAPLALDRGVVAIGHSAGGQLALCLAARPDVAAVVSLAGVCDLAAAARDGLGDGAVRDFVGAGPDERPDLYALADPLAQLPTAAAVLLVHGDRDDRVPVDYSRRYAAAAQAAQDPCRLWELPGVDHFAPITPWSQAWAAVAAELPALLREP